MSWYGYRKYRNKKAMADGIEFDSMKEAKRYAELKYLEEAGEISCLERQKKYVLIPTQYEKPAENGKRKKGGKDKKGRVIERECSYRADFVYKDEKGNVIVEDTKGIKTKDYIIKRKLMLYVHGIQIREV